MISSPPSACVSSYHRRRHTAIIPVGWSSPSRSPYPHSYPAPPPPTPHPHTLPTGLVIPSEFSHLKVDHVAVNASGTMVSVLVSSKEHAAEGKMFVYCSETNSTVVYDFAKVWASGVGGVGGDEGGKQQRTRGMLEGIGSPVVRQVLVTQPRNRIGFIIPLHAAHMPPSLHTHTPSPPAHPAQDGRTPQAMMWDVVESKLLAVQTLVGGGGKGRGGPS